MGTTTSDAEYNKLVYNIYRHSKYRNQPTQTHHHRTHTQRNIHTHHMLNHNKKYKHIIHHTHIQCMQSTTETSHNSLTYITHIYNNIHNTYDICMPIET